MSWTFLPASQPPGTISVSRLLLYGPGNMRESNLGRLFYFDYGKGKFPSLFSLLPKLSLVLALVLFYAVQKFAAICFDSSIFKVSRMLKKKRLYTDVPRVIEEECMEVECHFKREMQYTENLKAKVLEMIDANDYDYVKEAVFDLLLQADKIEEYCTQNKAALELVIERFNWVSDSDKGRKLVESLALTFTETGPLAMLKEWASSKYLEVFESSLVDAQLELKMLKRKRSAPDDMAQLGFFAGLTLCLSALLVFLLVTTNAMVHPLWVPAHRVVRMYLLFAFYLLTLSGAVYVWQWTPVDWPYVFKIDKMTYLRARHYAVAAFQVWLCVVTLCCFLMLLRFRP